MHMVLATRYGFHRDRLESGDVRQAVEQALANMIGEPVALHVVLAEKELILSLPALSGAEESNEPVEGACRRGRRNRLASARSSVCPRNWSATHWCGWPCRSWEQWRESCEIGFPAP